MKEMDRKKLKFKKYNHFILFIAIVFTIAALSSIYTELEERKVVLDDENISYKSYDKETKKYMFKDGDKNEVFFQGDHNNIKSTKTMTYNGSIYHMRVNSDLEYEFFKDEVMVNDFIAYELEENNLKKVNQDAFILVEAFRIISIVERNVIYKILIIQFSFIAVASVMFVDPYYFWKMGYFRRNSNREPSKTALRIIQIESVFLTSIVVCFPLLRLFF